MTPSGTPKLPASLPASLPANRPAFLWALSTTAATFALLVVGGTVNPTGSSLACPDWPLCYGQVFPTMEGGVLFEHSHRLLASAVGLCTLVLAALLGRRRQQDRAGAWLGLLAVAAVIAQGTLGGLTVIYRLPPAVSVAHLALSMIFFTLVIYLSFRAYYGGTLCAALRSSGATRTPAPHDPTTNSGGNPAPGPPLAVAALWVAIYGQLLLGALVRHLHAGRLCGNDPLLCDGFSLWPEVSLQRLHMLHRIVAVLLAFAAVAVALAAQRRAALLQRRLARITALAIPWLALTQVLLGAATVMTGIGVVPATLHLAGGALLLGATTVVHLDLVRPAVGPKTGGASARAVSSC
ncbi:MAG: heme A synthase [Proteobacteria bacterium]|nr:heme A synthase [Pseudomonadota bacterium]